MLYLGANSSSGMSPFSLGQPTNGSTPAMDFSAIGVSADLPTMLDFDASWMSSGDTMDWVSNSTNMQPKNANRDVSDFLMFHSHTAIRLVPMLDPVRLGLRSYRWKGLEMMQPVAWDHTSEL